MVGRTGHQLNRVFCACFQLGATGQEGGETFFSNLYLAIPGLLAIVSGIAAFITGTISMIFMNERAILVYVATAIGLALILFILSDFLITED